ncbi:MAG: BrnA antitoxin family protein [Azoarcus sp.]|jgi:uncharacterized protein (DUF4415 family)|nr:BrnA antitoxin family protein [Azoarcus sp.]
MSRDTLKTRSGRVLELPTDEEDARIKAAALADPDARTYTQAEWEKAAPLMRFGRPRIGRPPYKEPKKAPVTIRMDVDIIAALKATGKGWQTRVNEAMREWVKTHAL